MALSQPVSRGEQVSNECAGNAGICTFLEAEVICLVLMRWCACRSVQEDIYEKDNLQRCLTVLQDFDERLLEVLRDTDPSTVTEHGLYERPVDKMPDEVTHTAPCTPDTAASPLRCSGARWQTPMHLHGRNLSRMEMLLSKQFVCIAGRRGLAET